MKMSIIVLIAVASLFLAGCDTTYSESEMEDYASDYAADVLVECQDLWETYSSNVTRYASNAESELGNLYGDEDRETVFDAIDDAKSEISSVQSVSKPDCSEL